MERACAYSRAVPVLEANGELLGGLASHATLPSPDARDARDALLDSERRFRTVLEQSTTLNEVKRLSQELAVTCYPSCRV
jgi:hypothetical protein